VAVRVEVEKVVILIGFGDAPVAVSAADVAREATVKEKVLKNAINKIIKFNIINNFILII
jgi:acetamidase/formamidase